MRCVTHTEYLAYESSKGEARGRSRRKNISKRVVRNLEHSTIDQTKLTNLIYGP